MPGGGYYLCRLVFIGGTNKPVQRIYDKKKGTPIFI